MIYRVTIRMWVQQGHHTFLASRSDLRLQVAIWDVLSRENVEICGLRCTQYCTQKPERLSTVTET